jgi:Ala-tRNA(Pro) deacylase
MPGGPALPPLLTTMAAMLARLDVMGIRYVNHLHPPVFTVEEAALHTDHLPGAHVKNLFLEDREGGLWLVTCLARQRVKVNALARLLAAPRCAFAAAPTLRATLGVEPGAVTPLALVNDHARRVTAVWDPRLLEHDPVNVHPLVNTATTALSPIDLERFAVSTGHVPILLDMDRTLAG